MKLLINWDQNQNQKRKENKTQKYLYPKNPNISLSKKKIMKSHTEIKLWWITNNLQYKRKQIPATGADVTRFYNGLVESEFSNINASPVTFGKESRFRESREESPGPAHYNPTRNKLSRYSISNTYDELLRKKENLKCPSYFN